MECGFSQLIASLSKSKGKHINKEKYQELYIRLGQVMIIIKVVIETTNWPIAAFGHLNIIF